MNGALDWRRRRWLLWALLAAIFLLVSLYRLSSAVLADRLMAAFDTTGVGLGTLHASFFWVYALLQLPAGVLADRVGPRDTATAGALVLNAGAVGFALADGYTLAFLARACIGLGGAMIFISILRFCATWYRSDEFATMNGLTIAVAGLGGILATTPLAIAVTATGWRTTVAALGLVGFGLTGLAFAFVRDAPPDAVVEDAGLDPPASLALADVGRNLRAVLAERETWVVSVMLFCSTGVSVTVLGLWGVPYVVQTYGTSVTAASQYTLLGSLGVLVGPPLFGWLSDRLHRRLGLLLLGAIAFLVGFAVLALRADPPLAVVALVFFAAGFLLGAFALAYPLIKDRHATGASGVSTATINGAAFFGAAVFPTLMGYALDAYWTGETIGGARVYTTTGYGVAFGICAAASLVALACAAWLYWRDAADERHARDSPVELPGG